uniref:Uncharacterized protein n=1 Tax=Scleropages formosus TaxID=113540 RepID=A0A8C9R0Z0_SCLFO
MNHRIMENMQTKIYGLPTVSVTSVYENHASGVSFWMHLPHHVCLQVQCLSLGGSFASVHGEDKFQFIRSLMMSQDPAENAAWIGLTDCQKVQHLLYVKFRT